MIVEHTLSIEFSRYITPFGCGKFELITHKDVEGADVNLMSCNAPGISFYISQAEVIKLLNPNMYREIVLIDGDLDFEYSKIITKESFIEHK